MEGEVRYLHNGKESHTTAFDINDTKAIRILLPRTLGVISVYVDIYSEDLSARMWSIEAHWSGMEDGCDLFDAPLDLGKKDVGLYFFRISIKTNNIRLTGNRRWDKLGFSSTPSFDGMYQLSVCSFKYNKPSRKYGGIIYHIFVDRFCRGGDITVKDGAVLIDDWSRGIPEYPEYPGAPLKNNTFFGGTLWGVIEKLDYISSLGVDTIYLSPVFDAASNHKYDTGDYMTVDSMFGGNEALTALIEAARKLGIGIILDGVFNHTGSDSIYFNRYNNYPSLGAYNSTKSKYYSWYDFQAYPDKYTCWWDIDILPRINPDKPKCRDYFVGKGGVIDKYASLGIDGFRLDVADELSDSFISCIKNVLNDNNSESVLYGEVWEDASNKIAYDTRKKYYLGSELDGVMNYPIRRGIISYLRERRTDELRYALTDVINNAPARIRNMQMNLLGTHDTERIITALGGESASGRSNFYLSRARMGDIERGIAKRRLRMAYAILATLPGIPAIFYGDETALEGYSDPFNRMPYPWASQDMKLIEYYRMLGKFRRNNEVYKEGDMVLHHLDSELLIYSRENSECCCITLVNNSRQPIVVAFDDSVEHLIGRCDVDGRFTIPAYSAEIFKAQKGNTLTVF